MNMTLNKRWCLTAILALSAVVYTSSSYAATDRLVIESGDSAQSQKSANVNAYWEPNTLRCLDRRTGRAINP